MPGPLKTYESKTLFTLGGMTGCGPLPVIKVELYINPSITRSGAHLVRRLVFLLEKKILRKGLYSHLVPWFRLQLQQLQ